MFTITDVRNRILIAITLCATLVCGAAMANDPLQDTMRDALARNDTQLLTDTGGLSFIDHSVGIRDGQAPGTYRYTARDAYAHNGVRLSPESFAGTTFNDCNNDCAFGQAGLQTAMTSVFVHNDSRLLLHYSGGVSFFN